MKKIPKQEYTAEFKEQAVKHAQAVGIVVAAKELGLVEQTLRNWVKAAEAGKLVGAGAKPVTPEQMELSRLRAENARLKMHVEILKNRPRGLPRPIWIETSSRLPTLGPTPGQRPLAFWRRSSPSKKPGQWKLRTQLWWHLA